MAKGNVTKLKTPIDPFSLRGVIAVSFLYGLIHALLRLLAGQNLALDDQKENIFTQQWQLGYLPDNPPLYEWMLTLVQSVTGPVLISFLIIKYGLLIFSAAFLFLAARRLFDDEKWAAWTVYSTTLLYQLGYNYHQAFTHSLVVIAAVAFGLWALIRLVQERRFIDYVLLGFALTVGMLSKYNFAGFVLVVGIAGLLEPSVRRVLAKPQIVVTLIIPAVMLVPHVLWVLDHFELFSSYVGGKLGYNDGGYLERLGEGLSNGLVAYISFFLPLFLIVPFIFKKWRSGLGEVWQTDGLDRVFLRANVVALIVIFAGVVLFGVSNITERYVIPFMLPGFLGLMAVLRCVAGERQMIWMGRCVVGFAALVLAVRAIAMAVPFEAACGDCQRSRPFYALNDAIVKEGLPGDAIYIAYEEFTAGNLRRLLPSADIRAFNLLFFNPITDDKPCYFIWSEELVGVTVQPHLQHIANDDGTIHVVGEWQHAFRAGSWRQTHWGISPIREGVKLHNSLCRN